MFPTIFSFGPIAVSSLGLLTFLAFLTGLFLIWRRGKEEGLDEEKLLDVAFVGLIVGLILGRAFFILEHWPELGTDIGRWFDLKNFAGFSFFGGVAGAWLVLFLAAKDHKWNFWAVSDLAVFGVIWAQILVRLGQFLDGSFLGKPTNLPLGLSFPGVEESRFPVQPVAVAFLVLVYFWLKRLEKQYRLFVWYQDKRGEARPGFLVLTFMFVYGWFRFGLAFFRPASVYWVGLSLSQWVSLLTVLLAIGLFGERMGKWEGWFKGFKERRRRRSPPKLKPLSPKKPELRRRRPKKGHIKAGRDVKT